MIANTTEELKCFLAQHETVAKPTVFRDGDVVGGWRVAGFLARGGHAEVYRVVAVEDRTSGTIGTSRAEGTDGRAVAPRPPKTGALKILTRDDAASRARFAQETRLLEKHFATSLPYFYGAGENNGRPYFVTDLLEPIDLPSTDAAVARYLLEVSAAVAALHHHGLVHRDIKPANVMKRTNGEIVLIDLGLVKDTARSSRPETNVSIIDGKPVAVGTPAYAAPEQILGGEVSSAVDIHALGKLADVCFESHPPKAWLTIIRRATSSIPAQRYATVAEFAKAIRRRHWSTRAWNAIGALVVLFVLAVPFVLFTPPPKLSQNETVVEESAVWAKLCHETATNSVTQQLVWERPVTNVVNGIQRVSSQRAYRAVTNRVAATVIRLNDATFTFTKSVNLDPTREYFLVGPGTLDAELLATAPTRIHLDRVNLMNRATNRVTTANITYIFGRQVYLNFPNQRNEDNRDYRRMIEDFDSKTDEIRFQGPATIEDLNRQRQKRSDEEFRKEQQHAKTFFKNFHFPCRILSPRGKYVVETMIDSIYKKYGIDPNRIPTDAEVELVAYCFDVSESEARSILAHRRAVNLIERSPQTGRAVSMRPPRTEVTNV